MVMDGKKKEGGWSKICEEKAALDRVAGGVGAVSNLCPAGLRADRWLADLAVFRPWSLEVLEIGTERKGKRED